MKLHVYRFPDPAVYLIAFLSITLAWF